MPNNGQKLYTIVQRHQERILVVINLAFSHIYPPVFPHIAMENPPFEDVFPIREKVKFQPTMLVYWRVCLICVAWSPPWRSSCLDPGARCFADSDVEIRRGFSQVFRPLKIFFPERCKVELHKLISSPPRKVIYYVTMYKVK